MRLRGFETPPANIRFLTTLSYSCINLDLVPPLISVAYVWYNIDMQQVRRYLSRTLKSFKPLWYSARYIYLVFSGVLFKDLYYRSRAKRNARGLRKYGAEELKRIQPFFEELGIKPFLTAGSLLGCIQNGSFHPSSKDMDLAVFSDELPDPAQLINKMKGLGYLLHVDGKLQGPLTKIGPYYLLQFLHPQKYVSVDIYYYHRYQGQVVFLQDRRADHLYDRYLGDKKAMHEPYLGYYRGFSGESLKFFKSCLFEGVPVWIPEDPWVLLESIYGPNIHSGQKNIFHGLYLIREGSQKDGFEWIDTSHDKRS